MREKFIYPKGNQDLNFTIQTMSDYDSSSKKEDRIFSIGNWKFRLTPRLQKNLLNLFLIVLILIIPKYPTEEEVEFELFLFHASLMILVYSGCAAVIFCIKENRIDINCCINCLRHRRNEVESGLDMECSCKCCKGNCLKTDGPVEIPI